MPDLLTCARGHQWEADHGGPVLAGSSSTCPICGAAPETLPLHSGPAAQPATEPKFDAAGGSPTVPGYEILGELGRGGMGVVYKARHLALDRVVALKVILSGTHASSEDLRRFLGEAEAVAQLQHPHVVQVHEVSSDRGCPFFTMEFIEGGTLAHLLGGTPLPARRAAELAEMLARAVHAAHEHGIIHRDLKPANVLLTVEGMPKITDFGLAKRVEGGSRLTRSGAVMGTPEYMAPEQAAGKVKDIGPAADVYALGAILYEMLTGRPPFHGETVLETLQKVLLDDPLSPAWWQPGVPRDLETICLKCLQKEPGKRYASALALADDLHRFLAHEPITARRTPAWERAWKWGRRRPVAALAALVVVVAGLGLGGVFWQRHMAEEARQAVAERERLEAEAKELKVEYFANFVNRRGVIEGVGPLTEDQVRHRRFSYKLYRRAGRVERMDVVNGHDRLTANHPVTSFLNGPDDDGANKRECRYEFRWNDQGEVKVMEEVAYDRDGEVVWRVQHTSLDTAHYVDRKGYVRPRTGSGAAYVEFTWPEDGSAREIRYFDMGRRPQPDPDGRFGYRFVCDAHGLPILTTNLDQHGKPSPHRDGYTQFRQTRDALGNVTAVAYLDTQEALVTVRAGFAVSRARYDGYGNQIEEAYFDRDGKPALHKDGYAGCTYAYDEHGNLSRLTYFGRDRQPTLHKDGCAGFTCTHDADGNITQLSYFGRDGQPVLLGNGVARIAGRYDGRGNLTELTWLGRDGQPTRHANGNARITRAYDDRGRLTEEAYWGLDGKLAAVAAGHARHTRIYDEQSNLIEEAYWGPDGQLTLHPDGYARIVRTYDDRGNVVALAYLGRDGKPAAHKNGYAQVKRAYDGHGYLIEEAYFDRDGKPALHKDGYARVTQICDGRGQVIESAYFDRDGKPTWHRDGYARVQTRYDDRSQVVALDYFGPDGQPAVHRQGNARYAAAYDPQGNRIDHRYYDREGRLVTITEGYARWRAWYDERSNLREETYYGPDDKPVKSAAGYARRVLHYDERGNEEEIAYYDADGRPARTISGSHVRLTKRYDDRSRLVEIVQYGADGRPALNKFGWAKRRMVYDERGQRIEETYHDRDGALVRTADGFARLQTKYDDRGRQIEVAYFGTDNKLIMLKEGRYARQTIRYDDHGGEQLDFFDTAGKPVMIREGLARLVRKYDERGNLVEKAYYDQRGQPTAGWFREVMKYDDRSNLIEKTYFDRDGHLALSDDGSAHWTARYNERGNLVEKAKFDKDDKPTKHYARETRQYDDRGNVIETSYLDANGRLLETPQGHARWTARYDEHGNALETTYFDKDGKLKAGWAREVKKYDDRSNAVEVAYFDRDGRLTPGVHGYARATGTYDDFNTRTDAVYFDAQGKPVKTQAVIMSVTTGQPGDLLGLKPGDVIVTYDGKPVVNVHRFTLQRAAEREDEAPKELVILRGDRRQVVAVLPGRLGIDLQDTVPPGAD